MEINIIDKLQDQTAWKPCTDNVSSPFHKRNSEHRFLFDLICMKILHSAYDKVVRG